MNELGALKTIRELLWQVQRAQVQKVYTVANIPSINSCESKLKYYTVVHKCFEDY